LWQG